MKEMTEIRWHGRGGQGAKTACLLLADAAFASGLYVQGFPEYGPERMGAPITAYNRISKVPCTIHSNIYQPDYVVVVDESLLHTVDVTAGLSEQGGIIINSHKSPQQLRPLLRGYQGPVYT
ncbi:MAG: 2-oxoacid:acceptor oxidoreductase family protein, partial [Oscillospiraceae bacterium]|nr:2-oxoacid:acceptor oxidoreductase family protein [Oscillospiraceae bacterium]